MKKNEHKGFAAGKNYDAYNFNLKKSVFLTFGCLFFCSLGTLLILLGELEMHLATSMWKTSLSGSLIFSALNIFIYVKYRNTEQLAAYGFSSVMLLLGAAWFFGFAGFYFYFLFAPLDNWIRLAAIVPLSLVILHSAFVSGNDIVNAFANNKGLFEEVYQKEGSIFCFYQKSARTLEAAKPRRNPFGNWFMRIVVGLIPFILVLNRITAPVTGSGHGVFLVLAFLDVPMIIYGAGILVQTAMIKIYYPMRIEKDTGLPVLMKL